MIIRSPDTQRIHLSEIAVLIIESTAVSLTTTLLMELNKQKAKVIFCDDAHSPYGEIIPYYGAHNSSLQVRKQLNWTAETKNLLWMKIIQDKIRKQSHVLNLYQHQMESNLLLSYIDQVEPGDQTNREGHAAKVYFNAMFGKDFSRGNSDCTINSALDYGYSLLLSTVNKAICSQGRITHVGIWHDNTFNPYNLSSDIMEAFRPLVDMQVLKNDFHKIESFGKDEKHVMISLLENEVLLEGKNYRLIDSINLYTIRVLQILDEESIDIYPVMTYV